MSLVNWLIPRARYWQGFPVLPGQVPGLGHLPSLLFDGVGALQRGQESLGPVFWVALGHGSMLLFCMGNESFELLKHKSVTMAGAFTGLERMIGQSAIVQDGPAHLRVRTALNPSFSMRGLVTTGIGEVMATTIGQRIDRWVATREVEVLKETQELALDIIFRAAGVPAGSLSEWRHQYRELALLLLPIKIDLPGSPRRRAERAADWLDAGLLAMVRRARQEPGAHNLTSSLVKACDDQGHPLTDQELIDNLRILLFAGHETTASALAWLTLLLAQRPELWEKLCGETARSTDVGVPASIAEAKALPFGGALFREVLRRYAPIWFTRRRTTADLVYRSHRIPAGTNIALCLGSYLMDPVAYPHPERFEPGRWLERPAGPTPIEMAGFGGGGHFCLGYHLAWLEVQQFLATLGKKLHAAGLQPRIADGPGPREIYFPVRHPFGGTRVRFV